MLRAQLLIIVFVNCIIFGENLYIVRGELKQSSSIETISIRNCPESVDSCLYVCSDGSEQLCHPEELYTIEINTNNNGDYTDGSRYRIFFPWEYNEMTANKFTVTASWPCLSPTAVYASGNYAYFDIFGNDECPGTVQGSIWYGDNCQDSEGNIGSDDCEELIGRFCFVSGDTLNWSENADQSISTDICNACWMSSPAWSYYHTQPYSDSLMNPEYCDEYDHCHHSASDDILCGVGYLDDSILDVRVVTEEELADYDKEDELEESGDFEAYFNTFAEVRERDVTNGTVVGLSDREVLVDIGFKAEGMIDRSEFSELPEIGDVIEVFVVTFEDRRGNIILSKERADFQRRWNQ